MRSSKNGSGYKKCIKKKKRVKRTTYGSPLKNKKTAIKKASGKSRKPSAWNKITQRTPKEETTKEKHIDNLINFLGL